MIFRSKRARAWVAAGLVLTLGGNPASGVVSPPSAPFTISQSSFPEQALLFRLASFQPLLAGNAKWKMYQAARHSRLNSGASHLSVEVLGFMRDVAMAITGLGVATAFGALAKPELLTTLLASSLVGIPDGPHHPFPVGLVGGENNFQYLRQIKIIADKNGIPKEGRVVALHAAAGDFSTAIAISDGDHFIMTDLFPMEPNENQRALIPRAVQEYRWTKSGRYTVEKGFALAHTIERIGGVRPFLEAEFEDLGATIVSFDPPTKPNHPWKIVLQYEGRIRTIDYFALTDARQRFRYEPYLREKGVRIHMMVLKAGQYGNQSFEDLAEQVDSGGLIVTDSWKATPPSYYQWENWDILHDAEHLHPTLEALENAPDFAFGYAGAYQHGSVPKEPRHGAIVLQRLPNPRLDESIGDTRVARILDFKELATFLTSLYRLLRPGARMTFSFRDQRGQTPYNLRLELQEAGFVLEEIKETNEVDLWRVRLWKPSRIDSSTHGMAVLMVTTMGPLTMGLIVVALYVAIFGIPGWYGELRQKTSHWLRTLQIAA